MDGSVSQAEQITPLAITNWRDIRKKFGIKQKNRRGHVYIIGKSGTGKSSLLGNMAISDIAQGHGMALIDPHGDLAESLLQYIPASRVKDVLYFNPADLEYPVAFNPLVSTEPDRRHSAVSNLISVFKKIWSEFWGPRLEHILRHSLFTLLEIPGSSLIDLPRLLTDPDFRKEVIPRLTHEEVKRFWIDEFDRYSAWFRSEAVSPILNKIGQFLTSLPVRNIVGQSQSSFSVRKLMDQGKILIANLSKGKIGEDNCALLGVMLVTQIQLAALGRADVPESSRTPFYLYVDEVHNFLTPSFADMLSESRKFGLNLTLAHQYMGQMQESVRLAILGNVGTIISFRIGPDDAEVLANDFAPVFSEADLTNLPNYEIYLKLMIDGATSIPFSAVTLSLPEVTESYATEVITASRARYARDRKAVEQDIRFRSYRPPNIIKNIRHQRSLFQ